MSAFNWYLGLLLSIPILLGPRISQCEGDDDDDVPLYNLQEDVSVSYDGFGIPHVYGTSLNDLAFGQGYVTARDRMWHMDYLRRQGHGTLSAILGEAYYNHDLTVRALSLTEYASMAWTELEANQPELYTMLQAYAAGVNAWRAEALTGTNGQSLPDQILALGYTPDEWTPLDSLVIDKALAYGSSSRATEEMTVWMVSRLVGPAITEDLLRAQPTDPVNIVPGFYDAYEDDLPASTTSQEGGSRPLSFEGVANDGRAGGHPAGHQEIPGGVTRDQLLSAIAALREAVLPGFSGSNSWVISGEHTRSGFPILANDTHEGVNHPATYYQVHLSNRAAGGNIDALGYGFPGLPLFLIGRNDTAAWGLTLNLADVADVYNETTVGSSVRFNDGLVAMDSRTETIYVRAEGGAADDLEARTEIVYTVPHHGPLLPRAILGDLPFDLSVRWTGFDGSLLTPVMYEMLTAQSFEDLRTALTGLRAGAVNVVYADIHGDIGYTARADLPIREQLDPDNPPYMVLPGEGGYEWTSEILPDDLIPWVKNPSTGFLVTANNDPAGLLDDNDALNGPYIDEIGSNIYLGVLYDLGNRAQRIQTLIEEALPADDITTEDVQRWQSDTVSRTALRLLPFVFDAASRRPDLVTPSMATALSALETFANNGYQCGLESNGCLIYHAWAGYVLGDMFGDEIDPSLFADLDGNFFNIFARPLIFWLEETADLVDALDFQASGGCTEQPANPYCQVRFPSASRLNYFDNQDTPDVVETRDEIILGALSSAVAILEARGGGDVTGLTWGDVHQITFNDPAERWGYTDATLGPFAIDGAFFGVDVADGALMRDGEFVTQVDVSTGPSQRTIIGLDPAGIRHMDVLPGGQAERPGDPHFSDQLDLYLNNEYRAMPFYPEEVAAAKSQGLLLPAQYPALGESSWD